MNGILASPLFWIISIPFALLVLAIGVYLWCWISDKSSGKTIVFRICTSVLIPYTDDMAQHFICIAIDKTHGAKDALLKITVE